MKTLMIVMDPYHAVFLYTVHLCNALSQTNEVTIIAPVGADQRLLSNGVKLIPMPLGDTKKNFVLNTLLITRGRNFLKMIKREEPDVIHFQSPTNIWPCLFLPWLREYNLVTTIHDVEPHLGYKRFDKDVAKRLHIRYSQALIVHGERERQRLQQLLDSLNVKKKCYVIHHGEYSFYKKLGRKDIEETNSVLFFGQIAPYKGLEYLIKAAPLICEKLPDVKIIIAGKGNISKYANLMEDINDFEIHNEFIPEEKVAELFQRSKVVVLPYIEGSQTGIIPIAYSFRRPVVVTDVGSIPEVVDNGKTGFIVPPKDHKALAEAIVYLLQNDKLRKEMGENAYIKTKQELSWDKIAQKTIEVYKEVGSGCNANL